MMKDIFKAYGGRIISSIIALIIGLFIVLLGFFNTLFLFAFVAVGFIIGYSIDKKVSLPELWQIVTK